jgi:hypothetical protein
MNDYSAAIARVQELAADLNEWLPDPAAVAKLKRAVDRLYKLTHPPRVYSLRQPVNAEAARAASRNATGPVAMLGVKAATGLPHEMGETVNVTDLATIAALQAALDALQRCQSDDDKLAVLAVLEAAAMRIRSQTNLDGSTLRRELGLTDRP